MREYVELRKSTMPEVVYRKLDQQIKLGVEFKIVRRIVRIANDS